MERSTFKIVILGIADIVFAIGGLFIWRIFLNNDTILAMISIMLAFTTNFGFVAISQSQGKGWAANIGSMRTAITSGVLVLYFFVLSIAIFLPRDKQCRNLDKQ